MEGWARDKPDAIAQQTASLALMIHGLIVTLYRERALQAPDSATHDAEAANMRQYAQLGFDRVHPLFSSFRDARFGSISPAWIGDRSGDTWVVYDYWPNDPPKNIRRSTALFCTSEGQHDSPVPDIETQIKQARASYLRLLRSGTDADREALGEALSSPVSAFVGGAIDGADSSPTGEDLIANYLPGFQATGKWLSSAPVALQNLRKIAGLIDYEVAYQGAARGSLCTAGRDPPNDWMLGVMNGTAPGVAGTLDGGYFIAFQDSDGLLRHAGSGGNGPDRLPVAAGTGPAVSALGDGGMGAWYQHPLGILEGVALLPQPGGSLGPDGFMMMAGTSPAAALLSNGDVAVAIHGPDGHLWTGTQFPLPTVCGMRAGSSPAIAGLPDGSFVVALALVTDGTLVTFDGNEPRVWAAKVADGTSPAIAASRDGGYSIAFQSPEGLLNFAVPDGTVTSTDRSMMAGTSPSLAALAVGGYQVAFQDSKGHLATMGDSNPVPDGLAVHPGASPGLGARLPVG
ncbi:MAG TPA: hypothetical protein VE053_09025 [Allosphingosinicella sp.]|nr:hypothetical protein [Allosphingosinicella sp.]